MAEKNYILTPEEQVESLFPTSGNMFDSLAEAYYKQGNKEEALKNYTIALKLNPALELACKMIDKLKM